MEKENEKRAKKYLFWIIVALLILLSYFIIKPFIIALISGFILAYLVRPIYRKTNSTLGGNLSAIFCVLIILAIIILPIIYVLTSLAGEISHSINTNTFQILVEKALSLPILKSLNLTPSSLTQQLSPLLISLSKSLLSRLPELIILTVITVLSVFYILKNWDILSLKLKQYIPFKNKEKISKELGEATNNIVFGYVLIAIIEFIIAIIGFSIAGVKFAVILSSLVAILAFVPGLGPAAVWVPLAIYSFVIGNNYAAIVVLITGLIVGIGVDGLIAPKLAGSRSKIHPLLMLVGILGGVALFGIFGFIIGPLVLVYTIKLVGQAIDKSS